MRLGVISVSFRDARGAAFHSLSWCTLAVYHAGGVCSCRSPRLIHPSWLILPYLVLTQPTAHCGPTLMTHACPQPIKSHLSKIANLYHLQGAVLNSHTLWKFVGAGSNPRYW